MDTNECSVLLGALKAAAAEESAMLFGVCGGLTYERCVAVLAKDPNTIWRQSVRQQMKATHEKQGAEGTRLLVVCLAAGVNTMTEGEHGEPYWQGVFNADRPDSAGTTPTVPRPLIPSRFVKDVSRTPTKLPQIDPQMLSCHTAGGTWDPASGKCVVPGGATAEPDPAAVEADVAGQCAASGGTWDPVNMTCQMPQPPGILATEKTGLLLAVGGLGIVALTAVGVYLATKK